MRETTGLLHLLDDDNASTEPHQMPTMEGAAHLPPILCVEELAAFLRVNRKTVYEAVASGSLPGARRIGRTIRIDRDTVIEWLSGQGRVSPSSRRQR